MAKPQNYGIILFPSFQALDVFGPLDALNLLSKTHKMNLYIIAESLEAVSTKPRQGLDDSGSDFGQSVVPTHTFANAPPLDVLIVPGGLGTRYDAVQSSIDFIADVYPSLKYLITVCTGSGLAARAGVLDGKRATTNKMAWEATVALRSEVRWVFRARWVVDGNCWTSSGISAGIDVAFAWIQEVFGQAVAAGIANRMEYVRNEDSERDPFADLVQGGK